MDHFESLNINFQDFAYRWVTCFLTREFSLQQTLRIWDTYLSEDQGFREFHTYVCAALLLKFAEEVKNKDYEGVLLFL